MTKTSKQMKVLVACEFSGTVRDAFIAAGHDAISCDVLPTTSPGPHLQCDIRDVKLSDFDLLIAHPPCTALCVTGNRTYANTQEREDAIEFFKLFLNADVEKVCVENPVGVISSRLRPPDQYIQPYMFGHSASKKTGLWLKGLPKLTPTNVVDKEDVVTFNGGTKMGEWYYKTSLLPKNKRWEARSKTFQGVAEAMAKQWG